MSGAKSTISNQNWYSVGSNICSGIQRGINSGWSWLSNTVYNLASSLLRSAKNALGIHSPSRVFRDEVGENIGLGVGEGIADSEGAILKSVDGVADAIAEEFNGQNYTTGEIIPTDEVDSSLTNFSDTITDSFSNLLDRLQALADRVAYTVPLAATGTVTPHGTSGGAGTQESIKSAIDASNEELISVVMQAVTNATTSIVGAIQKYSGTDVTLDANSLTTAIINEINRRTRANGQSPLVGV